MSLKRLHCCTSLDVINCNISQVRLHSPPTSINAAVANVKSCLEKFEQDTKPSKLEYDDDSTEEDAAAVGPARSGARSLSRHLEPIVVAARRHGTVRCRVLV